MGELAGSSHAVATFRIQELGVGGYPAPPALTPAMLGGLSHEWRGIQAAGLYANFALLRFGREMNLGGETRPGRRIRFDPLSNRQEGQRWQAGRIEVLGEALRCRRA